MSKGASPAAPAAPQQIARFMVAGAVAAAVNVGSRYLLTPVAGYEWSIVLAFVIGLTTAWLLFRRFVFGPSGGSRSAEYLRFGIVNVIALAQVWGVSVLLANHVFPFVGFAFHPLTVAHVIGVLSPMAMSFVIHRNWSFRKRE